LIIPLVAAIAAAFWGRWAGKHRSTGDGASLAGYERFRAAMEKAAAHNAGNAEGAEKATAEDAPGTGREDGPGSAADEPAVAGKAARRFSGKGAGRSAEKAAAKAAAKAAGKGRTAAAQTREEAGEEESPRGPVAGPVP
jgi:hypothetical protein